LTKIEPLQAQKLAESICRFGFNFDKFDDPFLYPNSATDPSKVASFFFFIVAIDHRTHPKGKTYSGRINGVELTGAELMYALAMRQFDRDSSFFSADHMCTVSPKEIQTVFRVTDPETVDIAGVDERATLLQDCGRKLKRDFNGSVLNMVSNSQGFLLRNNGNGFLQLLKRFIAYQDTVSKKSFLLVKFLERRHIISLKDPENLHVPVDNILLRLALRTGVVKITNLDLEKKIRDGISVKPKEEKALRLGTMEAFDEASKSGSLSAAYLDDLLWEFGRIHCRVPIPLCDRLPEPDSQRPYRIITSGPVGECPFGLGCQGYCNKDRWELKEPNFKTYFY
jgi:hypothetical protein